MSENGIEEEDNELMMVAKAVAAAKKAYYLALDADGMYYPIEITVIVTDGSRPLRTVLFNSDVEVLDNG